MINIVAFPNLQHIDLKLLTSLEVLLEERSVSRAAERVNLSQSAMSRVLGRLRELFDDQLFVRTQKVWCRLLALWSWKGPLKSH